ncbi:hypothetical protein GY45DRAFT_51665 [Cubamyces sp. BRFM 1775]|nr:hypothetical protein GY45DRAFT_51665 [Cubamyces sp. BRFM 1775]
MCGGAVMIIGQRGGLTIAACAVSCKTKCSLWRFVLLSRPEPLLLTLSVLAHPTHRRLLIMIMLSSASPINPAAITQITSGASFPLPRAPFGEYHHSSDQCPVQSLTRPVHIAFQPEYSRPYPRGDTLSVESRICRAR